MPMVSSSLDGTPIAFEVWGVGSPTVVFVPGLTGDRSDFSAQVSFFEGSHQVVGVDLPGSGESGRDRSVWTMAAFGQDVATVVDHLALDDLVLVGHSSGGDVIVEAALRLGGRVRGLVWVSSYRSLGSILDEDQVDGWLAPFKEDFAAAMDDLTRRNFGPDADPTMVDVVAARMVAADPDMVIGVLDSKLHNEPAVLDALGRIDTAVFAINPGFKPNNAESLLAYGVDLRVVPGVGHYTMMEDPTTFNANLTDIIEALPAPN